MPPTVAPRWVLPCAATWLDTVHGKNEATKSNSLKVRREKLGNCGGVCMGILRDARHDVGVTAWNRDKSHYSVKNK